MRGLRNRTPVRRSSKSVMQRFPRVPALAVAVSVAAAACTGPATAPPSSLPPSLASPSAPGLTTTRAPIVASCEDSVGPVDPLWRHRSSVVGPLGFYGDGRDFRTATARGASGILETKVPVIARGAKPVTVSVRPDEADRARLVYGPALNASFSGGLTLVRFEPCGHGTTAWAGGLLLRDRGTVTLDVKLPGSSRAIGLVLGRPPTYSWRCPSVSHPWPPSQTTGLPEIRGSSTAGSL